MRNAIFTAHLFSAWATGAVLVVLSVTGALLVFENSMDAWLDPAVATVNQGQEGSRYSKSSKSPPRFPAESA
jgi:uncharacterized iron-regulated membrane protein